MTRHRVSEGLTQVTVSEVEDRTQLL